MTVTKVTHARQSESTRHLERKPRGGEIAFYRALLREPEGWFHLYEFQKGGEVSHATAHRWMTNLYRWGFLEKENGYVGNKPRHRYRLTEEGILFSQNRIDTYEVEISIETQN